MTDIMTHKIDREEIVKARRDRLREALRSNLKRRKAQARLRTDKKPGIINERLEEQGCSEQGPFSACSR